MLNPLPNKKIPDGDWFDSIIARGLFPVPVTCKPLRHRGECAVFSIADMQDYALSYVAANGGRKKSGLAYGYLAHWIGWETVGSSKKFFLLPRLGYARKRLMERMKNSKTFIQDFRQWDLDKKEWTFNTYPGVLPSSTLPDFDLDVAFNNFRLPITNAWYNTPDEVGGTHAFVQDNLAITTFAS